MILIWRREKSKLLGQATFPVYLRVIVEDKTFGLGGDNEPNDYPELHKDLGAWAGLQQLSKTVEEQVKK